MRKLSLVTAALGAVALALAAMAQNNDAAAAKLRAQEASGSRVMWLMHEIADVHGPRLTGSPGLKAADDWAVKTMTGWGLTNAHLEGWDFGHPGWANTLTEANVLTPYQAPVDVRALGWSPGTNGAVTARVVLLRVPGLHAAGRGGRGNQQEAAAAQAGSEPPPMGAVAAPEPQPTRAQLDAYLNTMKDKVRGAIVLAGDPVAVPEVFFPAPLRTPDAQWEARFSGQGRGRGGFFGRGGRGGGLAPGQLSPDDVDWAVTEFLAANGALARINDAGEAYGVIRAQDVGGYNEGPKLTAATMAHADYGRLARVVRDGAPATMRLELTNHFYPEGTTVYNAIGEIRGSERPDEVVMLGGHFDSWAGATGATDNGAGSAVALEAMRLLAASGLKPRRTIRVALWGGEEEGLLGSRAYVAAHFGTAEQPKADFSKLDAYINLDSGTGKPRGAGVFGPPAAAARVAAMMTGFRGWGFYGASATTGRSLGGSDNGSFNRAGLPGIGLAQDRFDYGTYTHHTNFDTYERIFEPDMREAAVEEAALAYALANAPAMLPRLATGAMPKPQPLEVWPGRLQPAGYRSQQLARDSH